VIDDVPLGSIDPASERSDNQRRSDIPGWVSAHTVREGQHVVVRVRSILIVPSNRPCVTPNGGSQVKRHVTDLPVPLRESYARMYQARESGVWARLLVVTGPPLPGKSTVGRVVAGG
jgi:hypothetical protein